MDTEEYQLRLCISNFFINIIIGILIIYNLFVINKNLEELHSIFV